MPIETWFDIDEAGDYRVAVTSGTYQGFFQDGHILPKLQIFRFQLPDSLLLGTVLGPLAADRSLTDAHAFADILDALSLLFDHSHHFQLQAGIECFSFSGCPGLLLR